MKDLLVERRLLILKVRAPCHVYQAVSGVMHSLTGMDLPTSSQLIFCNPDSDLESQLKLISAQPRKMTFVHSIKFILHPEGLLEKDFTHLEHFVGLRLDDSSGRPVVIITSLTLEQLFPAIAVAQTCPDSARSDSS
jgi:tRNA-binding EMAP/Myf-like protein